MVAALSVKNLTVGAAFGPPLLDGVSFELQRGERIGLIGTSGCGKSLTAATLCGLLRPPLRTTAGVIEIEGSSMSDASSATWRQMRGRSIFQIFQSPSTALTPARRVGVQLDEAARVAGSEAASTVPRALDAVQLSREVAGLFPYQLSGGMKQRVLIAMAILLRPRILIADEPTTGLDVLTEHDILMTLQAAVEETASSLVFISHDLRAVRQIARRTLVMARGRIVEDADVAQLSASKAPAARALAKAAEALQA
ncbi:MAG: hypothetical protein Rhims3KO_35770 [Hyphomicrobiales bacterium]